MATLPLNTRLSDSNQSVIVKACRLYRQSLLAVLPISILLVMVFHFLRYGKTYLPPAWQTMHMNAAMILLVLSIPLIGGIFVVMDNIAKDQSIDYRKVLFITYQNLLNLFGALISMILLPALLVGVLFGIAFLVIKFKLLASFTSISPSDLSTIFMILVAFVFFSTLVTKLLAPSLIYTDQQDANSSIDLSVQLVKGYYGRTFMLTLYGLLLWILLWSIPAIVALYVPHLDPIIFLFLIGLSDVLLALIGPWTLALMLAQQYDLQNKKKLSPA